MSVCPDFHLSEEKKRDERNVVSYIKLSLFDSPLVGCPLEKRSSGFRCI